MMQRIRGVCIILCTISATHITGYTPTLEEAPGFTTIEQAIAYRDAFPEQPPVDTTSPFDPNYKDFYRSNTPTILRRMLEYLGLSPHPIWTPYDMAAVLNAISERSEHDTPKHLVAHLQARTDTQLYVWGELHGAFHSLVRELAYLHEQGVIASDFTIQASDTYFIFTGNVPNLSAYSMETLTLIGNLILKNPEHVIYLAGPHERKHYWRNFGLERQIDTYAKSLYYTVAFIDIVDTFFTHLPRALYVTTEQDTQHALCFSFEGLRDDHLDEKKLGNLFSDDSRLTVREYHNLSTTQERKDVVSLVRGENWLYNQRAHSGLGLLEQERGATAWTVLSSPVYPHRTYYPFKQDAFAHIKIGDSIRTSTIGILNKPYDTAGHKFSEEARYNMYTSVPYEEMEPQHLENTFSIGSTMGLELNLPVMSAQTRRGAMARIAQANQRGGLHNNTHIRMYTYNDDYQPYQAQENISYMMQHGITTILNPTGTPTLEGYMEKLKDNALLVLFPITGSPIFRKPELSGVIHVRSTYADEVRALIDYMIDDYNASSFAFFYQDDAYGQSALRPAREQLKKRGISDWTEVPYVRGSASFAEQAETIRKASPQAIGFFSASEPLIKLIKAVGIPWLANKQMFAITFAFTQETRYFVQEAGLPMAVGSVTPNPHVSELPIAKEYREAMDARNEQYDKFSFEAYIGTSIMIDAAEQAEPPVTREKIKRVIESYNGYQFKGLTLTFDPQTRSIAPGVWIENVQSPKAHWKKQR